MKKAGLLLIILLITISLKAQETIPFSIIEEVPTFPGCHGSKTEKKKCLNKKMREHVVKHFNADLANELGLSSGKKRIYIQFKIDTSGYVTKIEAKAPHPRLKKEAIRIAKKIPKMTPGKQRGKPVRVGYTLPVVFNVDGGDDNFYLTEDYKIFFAHKFYTLYLKVENGYLVIKIESDTNFKTNSYSYNKDPRYKDKIDFQYSHEIITTLDRKSYKTFYECRWGKRKFGEIETYEENLKKLKIPLFCAKKNIYLEEDFRLDLYAFNYHHAPLGYWNRGRYVSTDNHPTNNINFGKRIIVKLSEEAKENIKKAYQNEVDKIKKKLEEEKLAREKKIAEKNKRKRQAKIKLDKIILKRNKLINSLSEGDELRLYNNVYPLNALEQLETASYYHTPINAVLFVEKVLPNGKVKFRVNKVRSYENGYNTEKFSFSGKNITPNSVIYFSKKQIKDDLSFWFD